MEDSEYCYYYLYLVQGNVIMKYLMNGLSVVQPPLESHTFAQSITAIKTDKSGYRLFAISDASLFMIPVSDCERHLSCNACVSDSDPLCGWCSVQRVCSRRSLCEDYNLTNRWIDNFVTSCFAVSSLSPSTSYLNITTFVTIFASNLPELSANQNYECIFNNSVAENRTEVMSVNGDSNNIWGPINGTANITCQVPTGLSSFTESDSRVYQIYLGTNSFSSATSSTALAFSIVQCEFNTNCYSCIDSVAPCGWCLYDSICVSQSDICIMGKWIQPTNSTVLCPRIDSMFNSSSVQVPALETSSIILLGSHLPPPTLVYNYTCVLNSIIDVVGEWRYINAIVAQIECLLEADTLLMEGVVNLQLVWGPTLHPISQGNLEIGVYICGNQLDCQTCLKNSDCNWCTTSDNRTRVCAGLCSNNMNIFTPLNACPPPQITEFSPRDTAVGGSVVLEVNGFNLFVKGKDTSLYVGDTICNVDMVDQNQIRCFLQAPNQVLTSKLILTVAGVSVESDNNFTTRIPIITRIFPSFIPQFGGSNVTVFGKNLLVGRNRKITAGGTKFSIQAINNNMTDDIIVCVSGKSSTISKPLISIIIDSVETSFTQKQLSVLADPQVHNIYLNGSNIPLRSTIVSGGLDYSLRGRNLGATLTQTLVFVQGGTEISRSICTPPHDGTANSLFCPGEKFTNTNISSDGGTDVRFELIMDAVPNVTSIYFTVFQFKLYPNPVLITYIDNSILIAVDDTETFIEISNVNAIPLQAIVIRGILRDNSTDEDICLSLRIISTGIICSVNSTQFDELMQLEIQIGLNANKYILRLHVSTIRVPFDIRYLMVFGVISLLFLMLIMCPTSMVITVCCYLNARNRRSRKMANYLKLEMNTVEKNLVDSWMKGMTEINAEDGVGDEFFKVGRVLLHDFKTFTMKILFSGLRDHAVLHPVEEPQNLDTKVFNTGLHEFEQLLHDKQFLLVMLHSMEDNSNFSVRDRRNVASMLTIALFNSMPYLTEVLFDLLREHINKLISHNTPKLLFIGTPSVAEKLLADWLAFNLYSHLQGSPSIAIYELFLGFKRHLESGPVDILNAKATNSLSEEKLLLEEIRYTTLDIEIEATKENIIPCRLLDCDTITQAKIKVMDKVYQGTGFYQRPKLEDVDLMLRLEGRGRQLLRDNDMTNEENGQWRKINTLSHYNIQSGMLLLLVPRKPKPNPGQVWDYPGTAIYDLREVQSISQLLSLHDTQMGKVYHLQKSEQCEHKMKAKWRTKKRQLRTEFFLPRLLATKRELQRYVDQLMEEIFPNISRYQIFKEDNQVPRAIKLLFDFFDEQRTLYNIEDPDVAHIWKNNSVILMFWVNILKNPDFILDIAKGATLDASLSVIAQVLIDSCFPGEHITKDSPTNKVLYNKEVYVYKTRVKNYYEDISNAPTVHIDSISFPVNVLHARGQDCMFHVDSAVYGLFSYAQFYKEEIRNRLDIEFMELQKQVFDGVCLAIA